MFYRRTRCLLILAFVLVIHFLIFFYINDLSITTYLPIIGGASSLFSSIDSKFHNDVLIPFEQNRLDKESSSVLYNLKFAEYEDHDVLIPKNYFHDEGEASTSPPSLITYDPRLTASMLLNHLTEQLEFSDISDISIPFFHWSDYVDMSVLEPYKLQKSKSDCSFLSITTNNSQRNRRLEIFDVGTYCVDDNNLANFDPSHVSPPVDPKRIEFLKHHNDLSTGFHVFRYGGRSKQDFKVLHSRSFLHDFMPTPYSLVLLLPSEMNDIGGSKQLANAVKINVNQEQSGFKPLYKTSLLKNLRNGIKGDDDFNVNVKDYLKAFLHKLHSKDSYKKSLEDNSNIEYEKHLVHEDFVNNASEIRAEIDSRGAISDKHLLNYKHGLDTSLESPYPTKYFFEAKLMKKEQNWELGGHYDWRFFSGIINYTKYQPPVLHGLIRAWFQFINNYNIRSWIAHGTLLSWYWNGIAFPWDIDFDVQMPIQDLHNMCRDFNQSLVMDVGFNNFEGEVRYGRYFLDCGTFISNRNNKNGHNNIDARFIDVDNGLYIDITGLALTDTSPPNRYNELLPVELKKTSNDATISHLTRNEYLQIYNCKNNHFESLQNLSPLKLTKYEGQLNYIPNNYKNLLINEYKEKAINDRKFRTFSFVEKYQLWEMTKKLIKYVKDTYKVEGSKLRKYRANNSGSKDGALVPIIDEEFRTDEDFISYLFQHKELLIEYILSHDITEFHKKEMSSLDNGKTTESLLFTNGQLKDKTGPFRPSLFNYHTFINNYSFRNTNDMLIKLIKNGGNKIQQLDKDIDGQDSIPQPINDALDELRIINSVESSTPMVVKQVEVEAMPNGEQREKVVSEKYYPAKLPSPSESNPPHQLDQNGLPLVQPQTEDHLGDTGITRPEH